MAVLEGDLMAILAAPILTQSIVRNKKRLCQKEEKTQKEESEGGEVLCQNTVLEEFGQLVCQVESNIGVEKENPANNEYHQQKVEKRPAGDSHPQVCPEHEKNEGDTEQVKLPPPLHLKIAHIINQDGVITQECGQGRYGAEYAFPDFSC